MALKDIVNKISCDASEVLGTGTRGCDFDFDQLFKIELKPRGVVIPADTTYDRNFVRESQQRGQSIILPDIYDFNWESEEDATEVAESTGQETVTRRGLYKLSLMFQKGLYNQKVLESLSGNGIWDAILYDINGNQLNVARTDGAIKGLSLGRFSVSPITFKKGDASQKTTAIMQFTKTSQFGADLGWISASNLDFNIDEIDGINQIRLSIPSAPINAATTFTVKALLDKDGSHFVGGLTVPNFLVKVNGATVTPTGVVANAENNTYTFTVSALSTGDVVTVSTWDGTLNSGVIKVGLSPDDVLYQAKTISTTVVS